MKHIHFDVESDGFYGAYWACKDGSDCAVIAMLGDDPEDYMARLGGGVFLDDDLGDAVAVPQVDEGHGAEVPHFLHPSGQGDGLVDVAGPEAAAGMGSVHGDMLCLVVTIRKVN